MHNIKINHHNELRYEIWHSLNFVQGRHCLPCLPLQHVPDIGIDVQIVDNSFNTKIYHKVYYIYFEVVSFPFPTHNFVIAVGKISVHFL